MSFCDAIESLQLAYKRGLSSSRMQFANDAFQYCSHMKLVKVALSKVKSFVEAHFFLFQVFLNREYSNQHWEWTLSTHTDLWFQGIAFQQAKPRRRIEFSYRLIWYILFSLRISWVSSSNKLIHWHTTRRFLSWIESVARMLPGYGPVSACLLGPGFLVSSELTSQLRVIF